MKYLLIPVFLSCCLNSFCQLTDDEIRDLKRGRGQPDTSYIYSIPYTTGKRHLFIQGANSKMSHENDLSYDFKMKVGSGISAARGGMVITVKQDSDQGGLKPEFLNDGNHIIIRHEDGSSAYYWHLKKDGVAVHVGDTVSQGQTIGYSGNTGYSAFPHLHFQVVNANGKQILVRFKTKKGIIYLRPGRWYKSI